MKSNLENRARMLNLINSWNKSNLSQKEFCKQQGLGYHVFHYWFKVLKNEKKGVNKSSDFIPVKINPTNTVERIESKIAEVIFPDGRKVVFFAPADANLIRSILH